MSYTSQAKDMRQNKRYKMDETEIHIKMPFTDEVVMQDIGLGGISVKADRRMYFGKEYLLKLESGKRNITAKGVVIWSLLSDSRADAKGNIIPIYSCGLKFTNETKEQVKSFIAFIEESKKGTDEQRDINLQASDFIDLSLQFKEALDIFER